jgi:hypothetical protein
MATLAQIAANRLNAMKSSGPRTEEGKASSRMNALRHGIDARLVVIPGEDPEELVDLGRDYRHQFRPNGPEQEFLVETLVNADWLRRRYMRLEAEITNQALAEMEPCANPLGAIYLSDNPAARALDRVRRHYDAAQRAWLTAYKHLEQLRRQAVETALLTIAAPKAMPAQSEIGFVPPNPPPAAAASPKPPATASETRSAASYRT